MEYYTTCFEAVQITHSTSFAKAKTSTQKIDFFAFFKHYQDDEICIRKKNEINSCSCSKMRFFTCINWQDGILSYS